MTHDFPRPSISPYFNDSFKWRTGGQLGPSKSYHNGHLKIDSTWLIMGWGRPKGPSRKPTCVILKINKLNK